MRNLNSGPQKEGNLAKKSKLPSGRMAPEAEDDTTFMRGMGAAFKASPKSRLQINNAPRLKGNLLGVPRDLGPKKGKKPWQR